MAKYIVTDNSITISIDNKPMVIDKTHDNFERVELALIGGASEQVLLELMNVSIAVQNFGEGKVQVKDGEIHYLGEVVHSALSTRILSLMEKGFDISPFINFMENLFENPSNRAVNETYGFLEACNLPITEDGHFLAYKKIKSDYTDCYTGKMDNSIGKTVEMPRNKVNENSEITCSFGLHVASYSYMSSYHGDRIVICKVNPKDVVAVPNDYNNAKMRVCKYIVVNEVALKDEQITANVIKDEDVYEKKIDNAAEDKYISEVEQHLKDLSDNTEISVTVDSASEDIGEVPSYNKCQEMLDEVAVLDLDECKDIYYDIPNVRLFLKNVTSSTSFWKRDLIDILHKEYKFSDCPGELSFGETLEDFLSAFDKDNWDIISNFLSTKGVSSSFVETCWDLKDFKTLINKIKSLRKSGKIKKKKMLKELGL